jgi:acetyl-CoA C-acetyltransferase
MKNVVITSYSRTPIGSFGGTLSSISATKLGAHAIKSALNKINLDPNLVEELYMGNVISAGLGQAPAKQCAIYAGLGSNIPCTTINKVCSSGMKSIMIAAQSIKSGDAEIIVAGGMESMSNIPFYMPKARNGYKFGHGKIFDGLVLDGLTDVYSENVMGVCGELCAEKMHISRDEQDDFAIESYRRSKQAWENDSFKNEVSPIDIPQRKGDSITMKEDEEFKNVKLEKIKKLRTVFKKNGTITAGNASTLNDGAAALVLMSEEKAIELNIKPLAKIISFSDASQEPEWFTTSPSKAIPLALKKANLKINDIDYWELNEAFAVVGIANTKELKLNPEKVNIYGGAVSLGHPLGCSGTRIITTLLSVLHNNNAKFGGAGICNGGGGASAMIIEKLP